MRTLLLCAAMVCAAGSATALELKSPDLQNGMVIHDEQIFPRCGGKNIAPSLSWSGVPKGTKSLVLTMIDVSVKPSGWSHWVVSGLPADSTGLAKGGVLPAGASGVHSNFGDTTYDGPCPPPGSGLHRYEITLWALKDDLAITNNEKADDLRAALEKSATEKSTLWGTVTR